MLLFISVYDVNVDKKNIKTIIFLIKSIKI